MFRKSLLSLCILLIAVFAVADKKKGKGGGSSTTTTVATSTTQITASEGSTAMAIRGIVEPEGTTNAAVLGIVNGVFTARLRQNGGTFKFNAPANVASGLHVGDGVNFNSGVAQTAAGRFNVYGEALCCGIASINAATHSVTVNEPAVGRTFLLKLGSVDGLRTGQAVGADFKAGTAWIAGNAALKASFTNLSAPTGLHP